MKDNFLWAGYALLTIAMFGVIAAVLAAAYRHYEWLAPTVLITVLAVIAGTLWLVVELRHITAIDERWERDRRDRDAGLRQHST